MWFKLFLVKKGLPISALQHVKNLKKTVTYTILDKDTIEIIPHILLPKRGFTPTVLLVEIVNAILYKLKTGVQWHQLPTQVFFKEKSLSWKSVYYHYRKWFVTRVWKICWIGILDKHKSKLDLSSVDFLDGSHIPAIRGGEQVQYQGRN